MRKTLFCLILLAAPAAAQGTGSNIGLTQYPGPNCTKPVQPPLPGAPPKADDKPAVEAFNTKVAKYNAEVAAYNGASKSFDNCMQAYIANGNADMQRIKQKLDESVAAANAR